MRTRSYLEFTDCLASPPTTSKDKWHWGGFKVDGVELRPFKREPYVYTEHMICINVGKPVTVHCTANSHSFTRRLGINHVVVWPAGVTAGWEMKEPGQSIEIFIRPDFLQEIALEALSKEPDLLPEVITFTGDCRRDDYLANLGQAFLLSAGRCGPGARALMDNL